MLLRRYWRPARRRVCAVDAILVGERSVPLLLVRDRKARRYILRVLRGGTARVTMPWRGTIEEARAMASRHTAWLESQLRKQSATPVEPDWAEGALVLFRGEQVPLRVSRQPDGRTEVGLGSDVLRFRLRPGTTLRAGVEARLWAAARRELAARVFELAAANGLTVTTVTVRNQRSRWGSCSRRGTISLNWRLIQAPAFVRDYIILHELAHLRHMNHSGKFWQEVARICPGFEEAELWLKRNRQLLR